MEAPRIAAFAGAGLLAWLGCGGPEPQRGASLPPAAVPAAEESLHEAPEPTAPELPEPAPRPLPARAGSWVGAELDGGETHSYRLDLEAGWFADVEVLQQGIDVDVTGFAPDGSRLRSVDSPNRVRGSEPFPLVAATAGTYRLEVRSIDPGAAPGRYELGVRALRPATETDRRLIAAEEGMAAAVERRAAGGTAPLEESVAAFATVADRFLALGTDARAAIALCRRGEALRNLGDLAEATHSYERALELVRPLDRWNEAAHALWELGHLARAGGDQEAALGRFEEALELYRREGDRTSELTMLNNVGLTLESLGRTEDALRAYDLALDGSRESGDRRNEILTLRNLSSLYVHTGKFERAVEYLERALELLTGRGAAEVREESVVRIQLGKALIVLDREEEALDYLEPTLLKVREAGEEALEALALSAIGRAQRRRGAFVEAAAALDAAREIFQRREDRNGEAATLINLGRVRLEAGDARTAVADLQAARSFTRAFELRTYDAGACFNLALAYRELGELSRALGAVEEAITTAESLRTEAASPALRSSYFATKQSYYELELDLLWRFHLREPGAGYDALALQVSERSRGRTLLELLGESGIDIREGVDPELLRREVELHGRIAATERKRVSGTAQSGQELEELLENLERVRARIRLASPRLAALSPPVPVGLARLQELLSPESVLLEYALGEERSFLWSVTREGLEQFELPGRAEIEGVARETYDLLAASRRLTAAGAARLRLEGLSATLLGPVAEALRGRERVLVVADGALHYLPFAAFPLPGAPPDRRGPPPLAERYQVVTLPSASALAALRRDRRETPAGLVAVVADPVFDAADPRLHPSGTGDPPASAGAASRSVPGAAAQGGAPGSPPRLYFSGREAETIGSLVAQEPGSFRALVGLEASREAVLGGALRGYRIVHFATHGVLDATHPELSKLILSRVDAAGRKREGDLYTFEISALDLQAELVVLSSCESALGQEIRGEGLVGLTQSFMAAGARGVVVSLWPIKDRAAAALMERFYRGLLEDGLAPPEALRRAQVSMRAQAGWGAPYYWAGFIYQGEGAPLEHIEGFR